MTPIRRSGILLHPTSLPGPHGSGDLGPAAFHFVDWLAAGGQTLWQILPLGGLGPGNSPYMSPSAFAGNELLIDLAQLCDAGWLSGEEIQPEAPFCEERVDYAAVRPFRMSRLRKASGRFFADPRPEAWRDFLAFCAEERDWLEDYASFMALENQPDHPGERDFWKFCQWRFDRQWAALKRYAGQKGVRIVGDIPIFVSAYSADVRAHPALFDLDPQGLPRVVAGVPPDYFSANGQHWGNPLYRWEAHEKDGYRWWTRRMQRMLTLCDTVRIDHFRGFESCWEIPATAKTAVEGRWEKGPGLALFLAMQKALDMEHSEEAGEFRIIAEDLGILTPEVTALRKASGFPGMRILQFAFDGKSENPYLPHNYDARTVVYTGTHDNDTSRGWWESLTEESRDYVRRCLGIDGASIHWNLIHAASASVAAVSLVPMQDVLGLGSSARMNCPGIAEGNWEWRFGWKEVAPWHAERLAELARLHGRRAQKTEALT